MQAGDAAHRVVHTVAFQAAVAEDFSGLHAGEGVLDTGADLAVRSVVFFLPGRQFALPALAAVRDDQAGAPEPPSAIRVVRPTAPLTPDSAQALQSLRLPGKGRPTTTTRRVSAATTI